MSVFAYGEERENTKGVYRAWREQMGGKGGRKGRI